MKYISFLRTNIWFLTGLFFLLSITGCGENENEDSLSFFLEGIKSIAFVGAHPDDELTSAEFLSALTQKYEIQCTLIIMTRGEGGVCQLEEGCYPDLPTVRSQELKKSAENLGCSVIQGSFPNNPTWYKPVDEVYEQWTSLGAKEFLTEKIFALSPDMIITFDPAFGFTGHSEHRTTGRITTEILTEKGDARLYYVLNSLRGNLQLMSGERVYAFDVFDFNPVLMRSWEIYKSQQDPVLSTGISMTQMWRRIYLKAVKE